MDAQGAEQVFAGPHALEPRRHRYRRKGDGGIRAAQVCRGVKLKPPSGVCVCSRRRRREGTRKKTGLGSEAIISPTTTSGVHRRRTEH
eukprot:scaffold106401_cov48-Phaeocystis_antarctica.AAC.1